MRPAAALALAVAASFAGVAFADIPPPPDLYVGPTSATLAGLRFDRRQIRHLEPRGAPITEQHPGGRETLVFLRDCAPTTANCRLAKQDKVLGWAVIAINGAPVDDDLGAFQAAFQSVPAGRKVRLTLELQNDAVAEAAERRLDVAFDRN